MKVIFVSTYPPTKCGIAKYTRDVVESLKKEGVKSEIVDIKYRNSANPLYFLGLANEAIKKGSSEDIIHVQFQLMMFGKFLWFLPGLFIIPFLLWLKLFSKSKIVMTLHDLPTWDDAKKMGLKWRILIYYYKFLYLFIKNIPDKIMFHSGSMKEIAVNEWSFKRNKIIVIPLGLPENIKILDKEQCKAELGYPGKKILLVFGFARGFKDYELVLRALKKLDKDVVLLITGCSQSKKHQEVNENITRQINNLDLNDRVKRLGFVEEKDLSVLFSATDVGLLPYTITFGDFNSAAQASQVSYQVPVIAANIHPFRSSKKENQGIITFDKEGDDDLVEKIKELLYNKIKIKKIKALEKDYWEKTTWSQVAKKTRKFYSNLSMKK